jgi:transposase
MLLASTSRGAIILWQKWSRGQVEARFANIPPCLIGMEACVGAHHLSRKLNRLGHNARLMRPYSKGQKNDFRDAEAIAEAVQRPIATKSSEQLDLQALHRVRERLISQRTAIINQIRAFLLERGIAVRKGQAPSCPAFLALPSRTFRLAWCRPSRTWLAIGDDWTASMIYSPTSRRWRARTPAVND